MTKRDGAARIALVTGAASGIGEACVHRFTDRGYTVVMVDISQEALAGARERMSNPDLTHAVVADVSSQEDVTHMVAETIRQFGRLDVAVNNAGIGSGPLRSLIDTDPADWRRTMSVNLDGVFLCLQAEIRAMLTGGGGSIINVGSVMSVVANSVSPAYVTSKHGLVGLTKAAALEFATSGVRVNAVGPGYVDTPLLSSSTRDALEAIVAQHPVGRIANADEVASVIAFLASDEASFVTGSYYPVDGGFTAQ